MLHLKFFATLSEDRVSKKSHADHHFPHEQKAKMGICLAGTPFPVNQIELI